MAPLEVLELDPSLVTGYTEGTVREAVRHGTVRGRKSGPFSRNSLYNCNYKIRTSDERNGVALRGDSLPGRPIIDNHLSLITEVPKFIKLLKSRLFTPPPPLGQMGQAANCLDRKPLGQVSVPETLERGQSLLNVQTSAMSFWPLSVPTPQECALLSPACLLHCTPCALSELFLWRSQRPDTCRETRPRFP